MYKAILNSLKEELNKNVQEEMDTISMCMELAPFSPYMVDTSLSALEDVVCKLSHLSNSIKEIEKEVDILRDALMGHEYYYENDPLEDISFLEMCEAITFQEKNLEEFLQESAGLLITKEVLQDCLKRGLYVDVTPRVIDAFRFYMFCYNPTLEREWLEQRKKKG